MEKEFKKWSAMLVVALLSLSVLGAVASAIPMDKKAHYGQKVIVGGRTYTTHAPIRINVDGDFNAAHGVISGNGTKNHPYIIAGWDIDAHGAGDAIYIGNTTKYFVVKDCQLHNASDNSWPYYDGYGIFLYKVKNGTIENNTIYNNSGHGIDLEYSSNNTLASNTIYNNSMDGIILGSSSNNVVSNNTCYNNMNGIILDSSTNNTFSNNNCYSNGDGIHLESSSTNMLNNNIWYNNSYDGISMEYSNSNTLANNTIYNNSGNGIYLRDSSRNKMYRNRLDNNGIVLDGNKNTFTTQEIPTNNTVNGKPVYYYKNANMHNVSVPLDAGQVILGNVSCLNVENLKISNTSVAIDVGYSSHITITDNTIYNNSEYGIYLRDSSSNTLANNTIYNNSGAGIYLLGSSSNTLTSNTIYNNSEYGIYLLYSSSNYLTTNQIENNTSYGIYIYFGDNNYIYANIFAHNHGSGSTYASSHIQAYNDGNNWWNSTSGYGNYWLDWAENNNTNDKNHDGIVDWSYKIDGGAKDYYPLKNAPRFNAFIIKSQYAGYFLTNVSFENTFGAYISWNGEEPEKVWAIMGAHNYSVSNHTGIWWNLTVNMGYVGFVNQITFYAQFSNGSVLSKNMSIQMLREPWWMSDMLNMCHSVINDTTSGAWDNEWSIIIEYPPPDNSAIEFVKYLKSIKFINGSFGLDVPYSFSFTFISSGDIELSGEFDFPDIDLSVGVGEASASLSISADGNFKIENNTIVWKTAEITVKVDGDFSADYPLAGYSFHFGGHRITIGLTASIEVSPSFALSLLFEATHNESQELIKGVGIKLTSIDGDIEVPFTLTITGGVGAASITGGGTMELDMKGALNETLKPYLSSLKILGKAFVKLNVLWYEKTLWNASGTLYSWNNTNRAMELRGDGWNMSVRYYNTTDYNTLVWNTAHNKGDVIQNIYPKTEVSESASGENDVLFYTYDNVSRTNAHGLELRAMLYNRTANSWKFIAAPPESNEIAFNPVSRELSNGSVLVMWNTIPYSVLDNISSPEDINATVLKMGIYNPATNRWSDVHTIGKNDVYIDYRFYGNDVVVLTADNLLGIDSSIEVIDLSSGEVKWMENAHNASNFIAIGDGVAALRTIDGQYYMVNISGENIFKVPTYENYSIESIAIEGKNVYVHYELLNGSTYSVLKEYKVKGTSMKNESEYRLPADCSQVRIFSINGTKMIGYVNSEGLKIGELKNEIKVLRNISASNITDFGIVMHEHTLRVWYLYQSGGNSSEPIKSLGYAIIATTPSAPLNISVESGNGYVNVSWKMPKLDGLYNVTYFHIYRNGKLIATVPASQQWYNDTNVTPGQTYTYYITAVNSVGESEKSNEVQATPSGSVPEFSTMYVVAGILLAAVIFTRKR